MTDFITVPIQIGFDSHQEVGELRIRRSALPKTPDFVFSPGVLCLDAQRSAGRGPPKTQYLGAYELVCVGIVTNANYTRYLQQIGLVPEREALPNQVGNPLAEFSIEDLDGVADALVAGYDRAADADFGSVESTPAYAARFIKAYVRHYRRLEAEKCNHKEST